MKKFGFLRAIVLSFYSADLYRDVGRNWKGTGLLYLMLLLAICWVPTAIRMHFGLHRFAETRVPKITAELPDITIADGVMHSNPPGRHEFRDEDPRPGRDASVFIIDDTIDDIPSDIPPGTMMLTRREFGGAQPNRSERRVFKLSAIGDMNLTRQKVGDFLSSLQFWLPPIAFAFSVLGSLVFRLVQALLYGSLAQMFAKSKQVSIDFRTALRIAAVAVTPVIVLRTLIWFLPSEPSWYIRWPVAILITLGYLRFAAGALANEPASASPIAT
ncbi:MAG TPA: DUF1189 family protein [Vicinamibacterales bacterium]|jgi:hypothetical protein